MSWGTRISVPEHAKQVWNPKGHVHSGNAKAEFSSAPAEPEAYELFTIEFVGLDADATLLGTPFVGVPDGCIDMDYRSFNREIRLQPPGLIRQTGIASHCLTANAYHADVPASDAAARH